MINTMHAEQKKTGIIHLRGVLPSSRSTSVNICRIICIVWSNNSHDLSFEIVSILIAVLNRFTQQFFNQNFLKPCHNSSLKKIMVLRDQSSVESWALWRTLFCTFRSLVLLIIVLLINNLMLINIVHILVVLFFIITVEGHY